MQRRSRDQRRPHLVTTSSPPSHTTTSRAPPGSLPDCLEAGLKTMVCPRHQRSPAGSGRAGRRAAPAPPPSPAVPFRRRRGGRLRAEARVCDPPSRPGFCRRSGVIEGPPHVEAVPPDVVHQRLTPRPTSVRREGAVARRAACASATAVEAEVGASGHSLPHRDDDPLNRTEPIVARAAGWLATRKPTPATGGRLLRHKHPHVPSAGRSRPPTLPCSRTRHAVRPLLPGGGAAAVQPPRGASIQSAWSGASTKTSTPSPVAAPPQLLRDVGTSASDTSDRGHPVVVEFVTEVLASSESSGHVHSTTTVRGYLLAPPRAKDEPTPRQLHFWSC